ncbi:MAG: response regulator transcription factor [Acidobacteriota bacterium]
MTAIGLYLIHDYRLLTEALVRCLEDKSNCRLLGSTHDPDRAISDLASLPVDIVIIDASAGPQTTLEVILDLREGYKQMRILPLGVASEEDAVALLEAGADGYLLSRASFSDLLETIQSVHRGEPACSKEVIATVWSRIGLLARENRHRQVPADVSLTRREKEVLQLAAKGQRNKEIARQLNISLATVKNHIHRILDKLQVRGRHEAIRRAYENGLMEDTPTEGLFPMRSRVVE